jgi:hypothetical protein
MRKMTTKKKVLKKGAEKAAPKMSEYDIFLSSLKIGRKAKPVEDLPLGIKDGLPALKRGFDYPSGVTEEMKVQAFISVLYVDGRKIKMLIVDLYPALINRVKDYLNKYDLIRYESSTKDPSIRKKFERALKALRGMGYLSPMNPEKIIYFLKVPPPGLKLRVPKDKDKDLEIE